MKIFQLDVRQTMIVAILVLYLGKYLTKRVRFFQDFNIPDAVSGGVLASLILGVCYAVFKFQIEFALNIRDNLLIIYSRYQYFYIKNTCTIYVTIWKLGWSFLFY